MSINVKAVNYTGMPTKNTSLANVYIGRTGANNHSFFIFVGIFPLDTL